MRLRAPWIALAIALSAPFARADMVTATFEDVPVGTSGYKTDFGGSFMSNGFTFNNSYYGGPYFGQFGVSTLVDNTLVPSPTSNPHADFAHQYGAYAPVPMGGTGTGSGGSSAYAVVYDFSAFNDPYAPDAVINLPKGYDPSSIDVANTTYTASSARYGDGFSPAFVKGDYLRLTVIGYTGQDGAGDRTGTATTTLIDFTGDAVDLHYGFNYLGLAALKGAGSLAFLLDTNVGDINGPTVPFEFAVDNVVAVRAVPEPASLAMLLVGMALAGAAFRRGRGSAEVGKAA